MKKVTVGIIGAASATSEILIRYLLQHPQVELTYLVSETAEGKPVVAAHPRLGGLTDLTFSAYDVQRAGTCQVLFFGRGHGESTGMVRPLLEAGCTVIDLSADFRLRDAALYEATYKVKHQDPALLAQAVYGLPEWYADKIRTARLLANPGCYVTSVLLAVLPLLKANLVATLDIIADSYSGISGSGRKPAPATMMISAYNNLRPYNFFVHRHVPEMEQECNIVAARPARVVFTPHVAPFNQGIMTTLFVKVAAGTTPGVVENAYRCYTRETAPFVRVLPHGQYPELANIVDTNFCDIGFVLDGRTQTLAVTSTLDNLVKGASGQAIENMNLMCGFSCGMGFFFGLA
ncbi:MAG TPA: N-acetyl-gamma-glutamyl-phosphate reductase, partial [bacterium]|nr:N-acetyl-gamma-glutamyl-phosphate reductase [bacterium]